MNPMDLTGKRIVVAGASSGIGKETAIYLSHLGAKVVLVARNLEKLESIASLLKGNGHEIFQFDLKKINDIENFIDGLVVKGGNFNGIAYCAGVGSARPLKLSKFDFIHEVMLVNFYAFVEFVRAISKRRNLADSSSIVVLSSIASRRGEPGEIAYSSSKAALEAAVRSMAKELANRKIRVNAVLPSFINTPIYEEYIRSFGIEFFEKKILPRQLLGLGEPIDVANAVAYLLSDASKFLTGSSLVVDGGYLS